MHRSVPFLLLFLSSLVAAHAAVPALSPGEQLRFRVSWLLFGAGEINVAANQATSETGRPELHITTTTRTTGTVRFFFPFTAEGVARFDLGTGQLLRIDETSSQRRKDTRQSMAFDYTRSVATYRNEVEPHKNAELPMPSGEPMDLIMALVHTRSWVDMKPGDKRDALVVFDDDFYELTIYAEEYEEIRTPMGTFNTLVLVPRMEKTEPKGMFRRGSTVKVWISQDERRLPVRFEVDMNVVGSGVATLVSHTLPQSSVAADQ